MNETDKATLRSQIANIDWNAEKDSEGRDLALRLETVMSSLAEEENRLREASSRLQEGLKSEDDVEEVADTLDRISSNIACALELFDEVRFKLFD